DAGHADRRHSAGRGHAHGSRGVRRRLRSVALRLGLSRDGPAQLPAHGDRRRGAHGRAALHLRRRVRVLVDADGGLSAATAGRAVPAPIFRICRMKPAAVSRPRPTKEETMDRRTFLKTTGAGLAGLGLAAPYVARAAAPLTLRWAHFAQEDHPANIAAKQFAS